MYSTPCNPPIKSIPKNNIDDGLKLQNMVEIGPVDVPSWALALGGGVLIYYLLVDGKLPNQIQLPFISQGFAFGDLGGLLILVGVIVMILAFVNWARNTLH